LCGANPIMRNKLAIIAQNRTMTAQAFRRTSQGTELKLGDENQCSRER
jgi:hypothetical protein